MAKEKEEEQAEVAEEQPKKGKKKLIIILAAVLVLVVAGAAGALLLLSKPANKHGKETVSEEDKNPPIYASLEPFTVNLADGQTYLQVEIKLRMADPESQENLKTRMPDIRNDIISLLSSKTPDQLSTPEGKEKLATEIQTDINGVLRAKEGKGVKKVLFGAFLTQ